jgi:hypothetical protein
MSEECFSGFEESWAWAVADPVEVRVYSHAEGTVCVFGFPVVYREYREPSEFQPVERLAWDCLGSFHMLLSMVRERPPIRCLWAR